MLLNPENNMDQRFETGCTDCFLDKQEIEISLRGLRCLRSLIGDIPNKINFSVEPVRPLEPVKPLEPLEPLEPVEPVKPLKPLKPLEPLKPPLPPQIGYGPHH